jgi:acetolactate synthase small subunit
MEIKLQQALKEAQSWMDIEGVEGVGQGKINDRDCIIVFISLKTPEIEKKIPSKFEGIPVDIQESGIIGAQNLSV